MTKRYYSFRIITYAKEEEFQELLKYGTKWEYIFHNKDVKEDGTPKEPHWHINIILREWKTVKGVCNLIEGNQNSLAIPMNDKRDAHEYLTHKNNPDKFQYDEKLIKSSEKKLWKDTVEKPILEKITDPILRKMVKAKMWGQDPKQYIENKEMKFNENGEIE